MNKVIRGVILAVLVVTSVLVLIRTGYILDGNPDLIEPDYVVVVSWVALFCSIVTFIAGLIDSYRTKKISRLFIAVLLGTVVICFANVVIHYIVFKGYDFGANGETGDYIENEWIEGRSLVEINDVLQNADDAVVYIGREDCKECHDFEKKITSILKKHNIVLTAYYTDQDREKQNNTEYRAFLDKYKINSVPFLIWVKKGMVKKTWDEPSDNIKDVEKAFL